MAERTVLIRGASIAGPALAFWLKRGPLLLQVHGLGPFSPLPEPVEE